jgi:geranylgeranyl diphosphate synthase type II
MSFEQRVPQYTTRIEQVLERHLPAAHLPPCKLHEAMRYSALNGGKRIRPLLVYATGEALGIDPGLLDAPAAAIEFIHAFSLVHDDLPAMDDDDLRRGQPSTHRAFDEATAILAADALQPLAFAILATDPYWAKHPAAQTKLIAILAEACGSNGMTGGQAMDMEAENRQLDIAQLEHMFRLKTGRLLRASVLMPACYPPSPDTAAIHDLERFIDCIGLAFQIRDDILDVEGTTEEIGKPQGADQARNKATYPAIQGIEPARKRADELLKLGLDALQQFGDKAEGLRWLAQFIVLRNA